MIKFDGNYRSIKVPITASEVLYGGRTYKSSGGCATLAATTDTPEYISQASKSTLLAASTDYQESTFFSTRGGTRFIANVYDGNGDCFYQNPSASGNANGKTIVDTVNRTEASTTFPGGYAAVHGLPGPNGEDYQISPVASHTSAGTVTVSFPFTNQDGTVHQVVATDHYSIVTFGIGDTGVALNSTGTGLLAESATTTGKVIIAGLPDFSQAKDGIVTVPIMFNI